MLKKVLKITGISLLVLLALLITLPLLFKGKIIRIVKEQINKNILAKADFSDVSLSFIRHFPRASVSLKHFYVVGIDEFAKDTLVSTEEADVAVNLWSVISGSKMSIYAVNINTPRIRAIVNKDGKANWNITKPDATTDTATTEGKPFSMQLQHYSISNGYIVYDDQVGAMSTEIVNLNHEGSGDFTSDLFTLDTHTTADAVTFTYGGIPYLLNTKTAVGLKLQIDAKNSKYTFNTNDIAINDLKLSAKGFFQFMNDSTYNMDISFNAPSNDFKSFLSLVPAVYKNDFASIKTSGKAGLSGFVKGVYNGVQIPAYNIKLNVEDGFFQYPDLPAPVKNIRVAAEVNNPDGVTDNTVVDISKAHIEFGADPFDFHLLLKNPLTKQYIDAGAKGNLDLAGVTRFVKLENGTKLSGTVNADVQAKGDVVVVTQQKPGSFSASGFVEINKLYYASPAFPQPVQNTHARIEFTNPDGVPDHTVIQVPSAHVEVGKDGADLTLLLKTPATDPYFEVTAKGGLNLANIAQFYTFEPGTSLSGQLNADISCKGKKSYVDAKKYDAFQTAGTLQVFKVEYKSKEYPDGVALQSGTLAFTPARVSISNVSGSFMQTNFTAAGGFDNLLGYALKDEPLKGTLQMHADKIDLNKWMGMVPASAADTTAVTSEPFAVPANIQFTVDASAGNVKYDKVDYKNIAGTLEIKDEAVTLKNVKMEALDGTIALNGSYATKASKKKPAISMAYDVQNLDIQKTFTAFNTVQKLMPVGQFLSGKLTSQMSLKGNLGENMMPDLSTLSGDGTLLLLQGMLSKFGPLDKIASTLKLNDLQQITVKDIKSHFEFANGKVLVKPFTVQVKDIGMEIGGTHGLDQSLNYVINMKVPREKLGTQANQLVNSLAAKASSKGINITPGDIINLKVNLGGFINKPTVSTDLAGAGSSVADELKQQASTFAAEKKAAADSAVAAAKQAVKDTIASVKNQLVKDAGNALKDQLLGAKKDSTTTKDSLSTKQKVEEAGKGLLKGLLKKKS
ncbi:AsmA-like C-terminal region [Filimonas lacunae]|uniref:AsmA-like C-terminal region n=1 Tax=Filimonas lacunae TaxID=477680 RepID=A0A173MRQ1_9BACT|nr:AsmA-like C-terminal region-containing protein [Filimonas lacunae]BAV10109.1 outer membrane assembly protein [Filimonas lacunae]SIS84137.1 AsmA-like C-terminal region [Filimonas lacunae]